MLFHDYFFCNLRFQFIFNNPKYLSVIQYCNRLFYPSPIQQTSVEYNFFPPMVGFGLVPVFHCLHKRFVAQSDAFQLQHEIIAVTVLLQFQLNKLHSGYYSLNF